MGTDKRERQKNNRLVRKAEETKAREAAEKKRKLIRWGSIVAVAAVAVILVSVLSTRGKKDDTITTASSTTIEGSATTAASTTISSAASTPGAAFVYGTGECAATDGSAAKTMTFAQAPRQCIDVAKKYTAKVETSKGSYTAELDAVHAPGTVNNFVNLARYHYFDGISCHRIVKGFMAQCGDPTGKGAGGPGYSIPDELPAASADYVPGTLAMANSGPNTNGSQFFTMFRAGLPPSYSIFGKVTEGMDTTIKALDAVGNPTEGAPTEPVTITKVTITES